MYFGSMPFDFEGMHGGGGERPKRDIDNKKFYSLLGIDKDASVSELKKAYRKLAIQHHPDKGGDPDKFKDISKAYEVLSDPQKRSLYDQHGEDGLDGSNGADAQDIFDLFFGRRGRSGPPQRKKGESIVSPLKVKLNQLYSGATRKLAVNRDILCPGCDGHGGPKDAIEKCNGCDGSGVRVQIRQIGPMIQQMQSKCNICNGEGSLMPSNKRCKTCKGSKTTKERKILEIYVEPGAPNQHKCVFKGEADQKPGEDPGDVVFVLEEEEHPVFKRKQIDLFMEKEITLYEALTGYRFVVDSLDDRKLLVQNVAGEVTKPGDVRCVRHEGMPTHQNPFVKGDLFIVYSILFPTPTELGKNPNCFEQLKKLLPLPSPPMFDDDEVEHHTVQNVKPQDRSSANRSEAYDEDMDDGMGGQRVQCRQQ